MLRNLAASVIVLLALTNQTSAFLTQFKANFTYECPDGHVLKDIEGMPDKSQADRLWHYDCFDIQAVPLHSCAWRHDVNDYDKEVIFKCGSDQVIAGVGSTWGSRYRDRSWSFRCCSLGSNYIMHNCNYTGWLNKPLDPMIYSVPEGFMLSGVWSIDDNHYSDRTYNFEVCKLAQIQMNIVG